MSELKRHKRKERVGIVISDKMAKTITVRVDRTYHHGMYQRTMRGSRKFKVHDEKESAGVGDVVKIEETRPLSKTKRWRLVEIVKQAT
jgi:small subunit ribosomal protein S17